jgi:hypothetical protein
MAATSLKKEIAAFKKEFSNLETKKMEPSEPDPAAKVEVAPCTYIGLVLDSRDLFLTLAPGFQLWSEMKQRQTP